MYKRQTRKSSLKSIKLLYAPWQIIVQFFTILGILTDYEDQEIDRLQSQALKRIYGFGVSYAKMREIAGITTMRARRVELIDKFVDKCLGSSHFSAWFPLRQSGRTGNRKGEKYLEEYARCDRLKNSPVFFMRRRLNGKQGKQYGMRNAQYRDAYDTPNRPTETGTLP